MANWVTIYLQDFVQDLDIEDIKLGVSSADWWTLGEDFDIEDNVVDDFMGTLHWKSNPLGLAQKGERPVQIHIWNKKDRIQEELEEIEDQDLPEMVQKHLTKVKTIVAIELGESQLHTMYEIIAFEIAYWLAENKRGLICSPDDAWFDHDEYRWDAIE